MAAVESSNQNDTQATNVTENGTNDKTATMEKNGHPETTHDETTKNNVDSSVSSSVDGSPAKTEKTGDAHVESTTESKKVENGSPKKEDETRGDKRQADETDTVAKKVARMENGEQTIGKKDLTGNEEPVVEPDSETNGHGKKHENNEKGDAEIKADTGKDAKAVDQEVVGQGTAV